MKQIKIRCRVRREDAIARGSAFYGEADVSLSDADVASLSEAGRSLLASASEHQSGGLMLGDAWGRLDVSEAMASACVAAIEAEAARLAAEIEAERAKSEAKIEEALGAPDAEWIGESHWTCPDVYYTHGDGVYSGDSSGTPYRRPEVKVQPARSILSEAQRKDPRIVARRAEVEARALPAAVAEWERHREGWRAAVAALEAEKRAAEREAEARREAMRAWAALGEGPLARAAREGREIGAEVDRLARERACEQIERIACPPASAAVGYVAETYAEEERRGVPSEAAYALLDALTARAGDIAIASGLPGAEVTVGPIMRYDVAPNGTSVWRTGVRVELRHPWLRRPAARWSVLTEPPPEDEDDGESED